MESENRWVWRARIGGRGEREWVGVESENGGYGGRCEEREQVGVESEWAGVGSENSGYGK